MTLALSAQGISTERHPQSRAIEFVSAEQYPAWLAAQPEWLVTHRAKAKSAIC